MYGLIHQAIRGCVEEHHGHEVWESIQSGLPHTESIFTSMKAYDDEVTFSLVGAASLAVKLEPAEFMRQFGRYWVLRTSLQSYGMIMQLGGKTIGEFLSNLDSMHEQVALSFVNLRQPSFRVKSNNDDTIVLEYHSVREGLGPFVEGLLQGLAEHFNETIEVRHTLEKNDVNAHDEFIISGIRLID